MRRLLLILVLCTAPSCSKESGYSRHSDSTTEHAAAAARPEPTNGSKHGKIYMLSSQSRFEVKTGKAGILGGLAHNHLVRARSFSGQMAYDATNPGDSSFEITVLAAGLEVMAESKPSDKTKIREAMLTKVLKAKQYAEIAFVSRKVERTPTGVRIGGELTLVGKTRPVSVDVVLKEQGDKLSARGTFSVRQTDFGIKPYKAGLGTIRVADKITFDFEAIGMRRGVSIARRP